MFKILVVEDDFDLNRTACSFTMDADEYMTYLGEGEK